MLQYGLFVNGMFSPPPYGKMSECLFLLPPRNISVGVSGRSVYSVPSYSRWLRDNPGKATAKWRWRDRQKKGGRGEGGGFAWTTRANSGLLIQVPSTLPRSLRGAIDGQVDITITYTHTQHLFPPSLRRKEENDGLLDAFPGSLTSVTWTATKPAPASLENVAAALQPSNSKRHHGRSSKGK